MSEILTDQEVAALDHALQSVAMPENFRAMVDRLFESHFALTEKVANPLQAAALAALVAWRKADLTSDEAAIAQNDSFQDMYDVYLETQHQLRLIADALLAAEGGTG